MYYNALPVAHPPSLPASSLIVIPLTSHILPVDFASSALSLFLIFTSTYYLKDPRNLIISSLSSRLLSSLPIPPVLLTPHTVLQYLKYVSYYTRNMYSTVLSTVTCTSVASAVNWLV